MITTARYQGLIYAGRTHLASTIRVEQTGARELTVRAGVFTTTDGRPFVLAADQRFTLTADPVATKHYEAELGLTATGEVDVLLRSRLRPDGYPPLPDGWTTVTVLICTLTVPPGTTDLSGITINVLTVRPGFPADMEAAADWRGTTGGG